MNLTTLIKTLDSGPVEASVLEFPACWIEVSSREIAIDPTVIDRLQDTELLPLEIPVNVANPWVKLFGLFKGLFKDDPDFDEVVNILVNQSSKSVDIHRSFVVTTAL